MVLPPQDGPSRSPTNPRGRRPGRLGRRGERGRRDRVGILAVLGGTRLCLLAGRGGSRLHRLLRVPDPDIPRRVLYRAPSS